MTHIDEIHNSDLASAEVTQQQIREERERITSLFQRLSLTGSDMSYWDERDNILRMRQEISPENRNLSQAW